MTDWARLSRVQCEDFSPDTHDIAVELEDLFRGTRHRVPYELHPLPQLPDEPKSVLASIEQLTAAGGPIDRAITESHQELYPEIAWDVLPTNIPYRSEPLTFSNRGRWLQKIDEFVSQELLEHAAGPSDEVHDDVADEDSLDLSQAKAELEHVRKAAEQEGYPLPARGLIPRVKELLISLFKVAPLRYSVYPMEKGEIAIHASNEPNGTVIIICLPRDVWCVVSLGRGETLSRRRAWFQNMNELPDPFVHKALRDLRGA